MLRLTRHWLSDLPTTYKLYLLVAVILTAVTGMTCLCVFGMDVTMNRPKRTDAIETITRNGKHLLDLINGILDLSKIEAGKLEFDRVNCSPAGIVSEVASLMKVRAESKGLLLNVEYDGRTPEFIQSDPVRLRQILINLLGNAIKFTEVGCIRVVTKLLDGSSQNPRIQFNVIDPGIGMTDQQMSYVFEPFSQADSSTTRKHGGTGLGLAISKRLAEMLGGDITVISTPGTGSMFSLTIETGSLKGVRLLDNPTEVECRVEPADKPDFSTDARLECRVLLAEDGPDNQRILSVFLGSVGAEVTLAKNGQVAIERILAAEDEGKPFAVILMDMQMPVMDGYDATKKLRVEGYAGPIIALTAHAMKGDRQRCLNSGCDDYVSKPVERNMLISTVAKHASRAVLG